MKKSVVVITANGRDTFTEEQIHSLEQNANVQFVKALEPIPVPQLINLLQHADVIGVTPRSVPSIDRSWVGRLPKLKGIAVFATGVDYIDVDFLNERNVFLSHLPDYSTISVAEHTMGLLLTMSRRIHLSQNRIVGRVPQSTSVRGWELHGKTIGIIGLGRIGSYVSSLCHAFGMKVLGYDLKEIYVDHVIHSTLEDVLSKSDIVSLHIPNQWGQQGQFSRKEIGQMKPGSLLLNVSRQALVDEMAIIEAIEAGHLKGYAIDDIFTLPERATQLIAEGRIIQTGHTAWYSTEVIERGYQGWVDNICGLIADTPKHLVNIS